MSKKIYLSGSMTTYSSWWAREKNYLLSRENVSEVFNPWEKESQQLELHDIAEEDARDGTIHHLDDPTRGKYFYKVLWEDFRWIKEEADILLVRYENKTPGTLMEIGWAFGLKEFCNKNLKIHLINVSRKKVPSAFLGTVDYIHDSFTDWHKFATKHYGMKKKR